MISNSKNAPIRKIFLLSSLVSVALLQAQTITDIKFKGLNHISTANAKEIIKIRNGDEINPIIIDKSIKRLYAQQYFKDIWVEQNGGILTYHLKEKPIIAKVELSGLTKEKNEETLKNAGIKKGDIYDETKIKAVKRNIENNLQSKGYFDSVVEIENEKLNEGSLQTKIVVPKFKSEVQYLS